MIDKERSLVVQGEHKQMATRFLCEFAKNFPFPMNQWLRYGMNNREAAECERFHAHGNTMDAILCTTAPHIERTIDALCVADAFLRIAEGGWDD